MECVDQTTPTKTIIRIIIKHGLDVHFDKLLATEDHLYLKSIPNDNGIVKKIKDTAISRYGILTNSAVGSFVPSPCTKLLPSNHAQKVVIPKLKIVLRKVMVTDRFRSAFINDVKKFDTAPPGQDPAKISPSCS